MAGAGAEAILSKQASKPLKAPAAVLKSDPAQAHYDFGGLDCAATVFDRFSARSTAALIVVVGAASLALRHLVSA